MTRLLFLRPQTVTFYWDKKRDRSECLNGVGRAGIKNSCLGLCGLRLIPFSLVSLSSFPWEEERGETFSCAKSDPHQSPSLIPNMFLR